jgi:hypothetical protein
VNGELSVESHRTDLAWGLAATEASPDTAPLAGFCFDCLVENNSLRACCGRPIGPAEKLLVVAAALKDDRGIGPD